MFIEFHRNMLGDTTRNEAFYRALKQVIRPGMRVADVGAGTGLLAFMARQLGAAEVYLIDHGPVLQLAEQLARDNHIDGLVLMPEHSTAVFDLPPVDVVVSETLGNYAYEEHLIENLNDARRFLKPDGVLIPGHIRQFVAPVVSSRLRDELCLWDGVGYGLDFQRAREMSLNNLYVRRVAEEDLLPGDNTIRCWDEVDLMAPEPPDSIRRQSIVWEISQAQTIHGFAVWWESELVPGVTLGTGPQHPATHWDQLFFPALRPLAVQVGMQVVLDLYSDSRYESGSHITWATQLLTAGGVCCEAFEQDVCAGTVEGDV